MKAIKFNRLFMKVLAAGVFVLFLGVGTFSIPTFSEENENESVSALLLSSLEMQQAQGEWDYTNYKNRFLARGCKFKPSYICSLN
jgi:hypothetical protein